MPEPIRPPNLGSERPQGTHAGSRTSRRNPARPGPCAPASLPHQPFIARGGLTAPCGSSLDRISGRTGRLARRRRQRQRPAAPARHQPARLGRGLPRNLPRRRGRRRGHHRGQARKRQRTAPRRLPALDHARNHGRRRARPRTQGLRPARSRTELKCPNEPAYLAAKRALHNAVPSTVPRGIGPGMPRPASPWSRPGPSDVHPRSRRFPPWSEPLSGH